MGPGEYCVRIDGTRERVTMFAYIIKSLVLLEMSKKLPLEEQLNDLDVHAGGMPRTKL